MENTLIYSRKKLLLSIVLDGIAIVGGLVIIAFSLSEIFYNKLSLLMQTNLSNSNKVGILGVAILSILPLYFAINNIRKTLGSRKIELERGWKNMNTFISSINFFLLLSPIVIVCLRTLNSIKGDGINDIMMFTFMISAMYNLTAVLYLIFSKNEKTTS